MRILKGVSSFIILTPEQVLRDQLLMIECAGRTCYQSERGEITLESATRFVHMLLNRQHESVLEHSSMTVKFLNCSRGFTHELVRHRLASFSQESTRYVDYAVRGEGPNIKGFELQCVVPPHCNESEKVLLDDGRMMSLTDMFIEVERFYRALRQSGWIPEDARQILPNATKSEIVVTANFREWRHIFEMRTQKAAHWEIRAVMCDLLEVIQKIVPAVFDDFVQDGIDKNGLRYFRRKSFESHS